jgi:hypothetical protein
MQPLCFQYPEPWRQPPKSSEKSITACIFIYIQGSRRSAHGSSPPGDPVGVPLSPPTPPPRLLPSPGLLSRELLPDFLPVGRIVQNWRHFSYRQEIRSRGLAIFNSRYALSSGPAQQEKCRNPSAQPGVAVPRWHRHSCLCVLASSENVETRVHRFYPWLTTFGPSGAATLVRL